MAGVLGLVIASLLRGNAKILLFPAGHLLPEGRRNGAGLMINPWFCDGVACDYGTPWL